MKKSFIVFIVMMVLSVAALCILPGYVMQEADQVKLTEQVISGDPSVVEGVAVTSYHHYNHHLFWDTTYVAGTTPQTDTEYHFSAEGEHSSYRNRYPSWYEARGYNCMRWYNSLSGGWGSSSTGGMSIEENIQTRAMAEAYEKLAAETKDGEEKSTVIQLTDYLEYYPLNVAIQDFMLHEANYGLDELSEEYSSYFRIPIPEGATYKISVGKNKEGEVVSLGGEEVDYSLFNWQVVSVCTDTDFYFTFHSYSNGTKIDTCLIPDGFGIFRQPYSMDENGEIIVDPEEKEMVYALTDDFYVGGELLLDVNAANQLLILTDNDDVTCFQVVDLETMEQVQYGEFPRPAKKSWFQTLIRATDEFLVLGYGEGYFAVIDWTEERGYAHQFTIQLPEDNLLYNHGRVNCDDLDWNGEQLAFVCYGTREYSATDTCNFELAVYDKTGQIYYGKYFNSLLTEQEYDKNRETILGSLWQGCEPRTNVSIDVTWP